MKKIKKSRSVIEAEKRQVEIINAINNHAQTLNNITDGLLFMTTKFSLLCDKLNIKELELDNEIQEKIQAEVEKNKLKESDNGVESTTAEPITASN